LKQDLNEVRIIEDSEDIDASGRKQERKQEALQGTSQGVARILHVLKEGSCGNCGSP
jgi:hypothetical protein